MRLVVAAVGRAKPGPERALFDHYCARLGWSLTLKEVEEKRPLPVLERMAREGELLAAQIPPGAALVVLDERGKPQDSLTFAAKLGAWRDDGRDVAFVIGGADGHGEAMRGRADLLNHPYHRGRLAD